jgi:hypothetical protein
MWRSCFASRRASGQYADSFRGESKSQYVSSSRHWIVDCISDPIPRHAAAATPRTIAATGAAAGTEAMAETATKATITMITTMITLMIRKTWRKRVRKKRR